MAVARAGDVEPVWIVECNRIADGRPDTDRDEMAGIVLQAMVTSSVVCPSPSFAQIRAAKLCLRSCRMAHAKKHMSSDHPCFGSAGFGTDLPTSALQRFRPLLGIS